MPRSRPKLPPYRTLRDLPGIGPAMVRDFTRLGIHTPIELAAHSPDALYRRITELEGQPVDRCVLYTYRCAIYAARTPQPDPHILQWWLWMDEHLPQRPAL